MGCSILRLGGPKLRVEASGTAVGGGQDSPGDGSVCPVIQIFEALLSSEREEAGEGGSVHRSGRVRKS